MRILQKFLFCFFLCFVFLFAGCASLARPELSAEDEALLYPVASYVPEVFDWQEISDETGVVPGIWRFDFESRDPRFSLIYHAVKINLDRPELKIVCSQWERTSDFATREDCLVAINATPFTKTSLVGIHKDKGKLLSPSNSRYAAIAFDENFAKIFENQKDEDFLKFNFAFGGFFIVLKNGQVCQDFIRRHTSRSGAGLSEDGKTLYLLVVEGERSSQSTGLSYPQCGEIFKAMGCHDALEFDGGGSSELCINGRSLLSYKVRRVQGNSFGFKVK